MPNKALPYASTAPRIRGAFTLLEVLLAIAILAALSAVVIPQIGSVLGDQQIAGAASQLRAEMTRLRVRAMREGRVMMLEGMIDSGQLRIKPYFSMQDSVEALDQTGSQSALLQGAEQAAVDTDIATDSSESEEIIELPEGVSVESVGVTSAARAMQIEQEALSDQGQGWSRPILFYPDGVTSTGTILLKHEKNGKRAVKIRGITGDVTIERAGASDD